MHDVSKILAAARYAAAAHANQKRKYTGEPYIVHPLEVAKITSDFGGTTDMICAALLHDTVEDTNVTLSDIREFFGQEVEELVYWLTDVSVPQDGNREARKTKDRIHSSFAPAAAQSVKVADLISNSNSILLNDKNFAVVYMKEKEKLLAVLTEANPELLTIANHMVQAYRSMK